MNHRRPEPPSLSPGYYGKLPARADFIGRRLSRTTIEQWDPWLQACIAHSQQVLGSSWQNHYLTAPPWRFALPARCCGETALAGVMLPSVDAVGRCFPFLVAQELPQATDPAAVAANAASWFDAAEALALTALDGAFDLSGLDRPLPPIPGSARVSRDASRTDTGAVWIELPMLSALGPALQNAMTADRHVAVWWTCGGDGFSPGLAITRGLIAPDGFAALLDGGWARHGWLSQASAAQAEPELSWDRDS